MNPQQPQQSQQTAKELDRVAKQQLRQEMLLLAIKMRLRGVRYETISDHLTAAGYKITEQQIRVWFAIGGECHDTFQAMKAQRIRELHENISNMDNRLKEAADDALTLLQRAASENPKDHPTPLQIQVAQDLLDRAGYAKSSKVSVDGKLEDPGMKTLAEGIKNILERQHG